MALERATTPAKTSCVVDPRVPISWPGLSLRLMIDVCSCVCKVCVGSIEWLIGMGRSNRLLGRTGRARSIVPAIGRSIDRLARVECSSRVHIEDTTTRAARVPAIPPDGIHRSIERSHAAWGRSGRGWQEQWRHTQQGQLSEAGVGAAAGKPAHHSTARHANQRSPLYHHHLSLTTACGGRQRQVRSQASTTEVRRMCGRAGGWVGGCWFDGSGGVGRGESDDKSSFRLPLTHCPPPVHDRPTGRAK